MDELSPNFVPGDGPKPCPIMIVGEAPGAEEDQQLKPFVGRAGKLLTEALEDAGLSREAVYITNIVKQRPPNNRKPHPHEIEAHMPYLVNEFGEVHPFHILLLGNTALSALTMWDGGIMKHRGRIGQHHFPTDINVYATLHPSAALRSKENRMTFFADVRTFAKITQSMYTPSLRGDDVIDGNKT